jgi:NAD(P)H-nitrite reductase large subunit
VLRGTNEPTESPALAADDTVVCFCMGIEASTLVNAMEGGCRTVQALLAHAPRQRLEARSGSRR